MVKLKIRSAKPQSEPLLYKTDCAGFRLIARPAHCGFGLARQLERATP